MAKVYARIDGVVRWSGGTAVLSKGKTTADSDHPLVRERPDLWVSDEPAAELKAGPRVERATRAPGEVRGRSSRRG